MGARFVVVKRRLIEVQNDRVVSVAELAELANAEQGLPKELHALFDNSSGNFVLSVRNTHAQAIFLLPPFEPTGIDRDCGHSMAVEQACGNIPCDELIRFERYEIAGKRARCFFPRLRLSAVNSCQSIAYRRPLHHSYSSCRTRTAENWRPPPGALFLKCSLTGA